MTKVYEALTKLLEVGLLSMRHPYRIERRIEDRAITFHLEYYRVNCCYVMVDWDKDGQGKYPYLTHYYTDLETDPTPVTDLGGHSSRQAEDQAIVDYYTAEQHLLKMLEEVLTNVILEF